MANQGEQPQKNSVPAGNSDTTKGTPGSRTNEDNNEDWGSQGEDRNDEGTSKDWGSQGEDEDGTPS
jgi:hypothetical protein